MFFVLHKSKFSCVTSALPHSLFQLNGFQVLPGIDVRSVVNTVQGKGAESKKRDKHIKPGHCHSALGYQSSLKRLLADIRIVPNSRQFRR